MRVPAGFEAADPHIAADVVAAGAVALNPRGDLHSEENIRERLAGRPGPDSQPWDPDALAAGGIGAVLSLNDAARVDAQALRTAGIAHAWVPFSDAAPPRPGDAATCVAALPRAFAFVREQIGQGRAALVHCYSGKDRTGMFMCYYLCRETGMGIDDTVAAVRRVRPIALSAEGWEPFTREVLAEALDGYDRRATPPAPRARSTGSGE